jgi:hypothetical protein
MVGVGAASVGSLLAAREQVNSAAEAAALAAAVATYPPTGASNPTHTASEYAARNGAVLSGCRCEVNGGLTDRTVTVTAFMVRSVPLFGELRINAMARAEFSPRDWLGR